MIAFNFLPHRALARQQQRERFRRKLGLAAGLGLLLALLGLVGLQRQISVQQEKTNCWKQTSLVLTQASKRWPCCRPR